MSTIPASQLVSVIPNVLSAGGSALDLQGLLLTHSERVPTGTVISLPNDGVSVASLFGAVSDEAAAADVYFAGFNNSTRKPASVLFAQYNSTTVGAVLRGGKVAQLSLPQLKAVSGGLSIMINGVARTIASVDLSSATSYSAAAALLQSDLNASPPQQAEVTGSIATNSASLTASVGGYIMNVTDVSSGTVIVGAVLSGGDVTAGTRVVGQLSGDSGGVGTYAVSIAQTLESTALTAACGELTVTAVSSGTLSVGQIIADSGSSVTAGTQITALGDGEGLAGTYYVSESQMFASGTLTASVADVDVEYDSVSGGMLVRSGVIGAGSTIDFATGTAADKLYLTADTGAMLSQGAAAATPAALMDELTQQTQDWATFMHLFDPDGGVGSGQRQLFAEWCTAQDNRYCYVAFDNDATAATSSAATSSFGAIVASAEESGTCVVYDPTRQWLDAFICGIAAALNFDALNGRATFAFRGQAGLVASVTDATAASNLAANGYNFYGAYATANQQFLELQKGTVSGKFQWMDSYINQIWLNNALQLSLMVLLQNINSVPYNQFGYGLIKTACADPIDAAVNFGAIRVGVTLTEAQKAEVNAAAGLDVSEPLYAQGWFLQVKDASGQTRQARTTPPINFWYMDGGSIQQIVLSSVLIQ